TSYVYLPYVDGSVNTITYPSSRTMNYNTGGAGRLLSVQDNSTSTYYANYAHYAPPGGLSSLTNNGSALTFTAIFNSRLQPCWIYATTGTALPWNSTACTGSTTPGSVIDLKYNFNLGVSDNGNVSGIVNDIDATRSQTYTYDSLNRISTAQTQTTGVTIPNANC